MLLIFKAAPLTETRVPVKGYTTRAGKAVAPPQPEIPEPYPDVEPGDHVYVRHPHRGPISVRVLATGKHGLTAACPMGDLYRVHWERILGVKERMRRRYTIVDNGAEGCILEDDRGKRRYMAHAEESPQNRANGDSGGSAKAGIPKSHPAKKTAPKALKKTFPTIARAILLRAYQPGLFDDIVRVSGHTTKRGTVVAPYHAKRKKRTDPPPTADLFADDRAVRSTTSKIIDQSGGLIHFGQKEPPAPGTARIAVWRKQSSTPIGQVGGGTFFYIQPVNPLTECQIPFRTFDLDLPEDKILRVPAEDCEAYEGLPAEALFYAWKLIPPHCRDSNDPEQWGEAIDRVVAQAALERGYDAIVYGDQELQLLDPQYLRLPESEPPDLTPTDPQMPPGNPDLIARVNRSAIGVVLRPEVFLIPTPSIIRADAGAAHEDSLQKLARARKEDPDDYRRALQRHVKTLVARSHIWIRIPTRVLNKIIDEGFKNQYETRRSGGTLDPEVRQTFEAFFFGYPEETGTLTAEQAARRPIYGYLSDHPDGYIQGQDFNLGGYGSISVRFKNTVRARTTWCGDDSLSMMSMAESQTENPEQPGPCIPQFARFIPSPVERPSYRSLSLDFRNPLIPIADDPLSNESSHHPNNARYWEAQIHGDHPTAADIAEVVITPGAGKLPESALAKLKKLGIPVRFILKTPQPIDP